MFLKKFFALVVCVSTIMLNKDVGCIKYKQKRFWRSCKIEVPVLFIHFIQQQRVKGFLQVAEFHGGKKLMKFSIETPRDPVWNIHGITMVLGISLITTIHTTHTNRWQQQTSTVIVTSPRVRDQSDRLRTRTARERAENYDWQAAAGPERRRSSHHWYSEVRLGFDAHPPRRTALVGRSATRHLKLCVTVYKCLHGLAPQYLSELCVPVTDVAGRRQLRSASRELLYFPRYNMSNYGRRAFFYAGPHA